MAEEYYLVEKGDTLYSISQKFNVPISRIKQLNNLQNNTLMIGQKIYLADINTNDNLQKHIVQRGETLYSIAKKYNITLEKLKEQNNITDNILQIGQVLTISEPENDKNELEPNYSLNPNNVQEEYIIYYVKRGDSLWKIATAYNITVPDLIEKNNLKNLTLQIGQKLLVPKPDELYIVQNGDTLWSISKKYGITVDELKEKNNLKQNLLSVGQALKVK